MPLPGTVGEAAGNSADMNVQSHDRDDLRAEHMRVEGYVQGVGFRYHVCDLARRTGLVGWVRNRLDGSVEVLAQGSPEEVERLAAALALADGPPLARVTSIDRKAVEMDPKLSGFRIRA